MELKDKVVVITGGVSGLGQATARYMVGEKRAKVALLDLNEEAGAAMVEELGEANAIFCQTDVTSEESIDAAIAAIIPATDASSVGRIRQLLDPIVKRLSDKTSQKEVWSH